MLCALVACGVYLSGRGYVMHKPKLSALQNCIIQVGLKAHKASVLLQLGDLSAKQMCRIQMKLLTELVSTAMRSAKQLVFKP